VKSGVETSSGSYYQFLTVSRFEIFRVLPVGGVANAHIYDTTTLQDRLLQASYGIHSLCATRADVLSTIVWVNEVFSVSGLRESRTVASL